MKTTSNGEVASESYYSIDECIINEESQYDGFYASLVLYVCPSMLVISSNVLISYSPGWLSSFHRLVYRTHVFNVFLSFIIV